MPAGSCTFPPLLPSFPLHHHQRRSLLIEQMHFLLNETSSNHSLQIGIKQEKEDSNDIDFGGEDKDFGDKWEQISEEKTSKSFGSHLEESEPSNHHHPQLHNFHQNHQANSILSDHSQSPTLQQGQQQQHHIHQHQQHVPDEVSLDSQDNPEGSNTPSASTGSASSPCPADNAKETTSFLFVGPLGKKRKYSRQRATSDDNESESHPPTAAGSPETPEDEMDQSQSPSPEDNSQSSVGRLNRKNLSPAHESNSVGSSGTVDQVSGLVSSTPPIQRSATTEEESGAEESAGEVSNMGMPAAVTTTASSIISKPSPIIGAPTSVIRRVNRKKQEHPLPLNLSVSSPPSNSNSSFSSLSGPSTPNVVSASPSTGRPVAIASRSAVEPTAANPSVIRDELFFEGRSASDRQVFIWRYRDDVTAPSPLTTTAAGPMSPSSTISATSFVVPDVGGSKHGSSGASSSASSTISQLPPGSHDPVTGQPIDPKMAGLGDTATSGSAASGKPPKKKLKCNDCGKEFSQLRNYRYHRSRHEGSDQFSCTCPVCGKQFNDRGYLSSHMKIHRNAKEYRCEFCTKGFNQRVAYNMHRRIHTGHRPHQCEVCGKSFSRRMLLKQHMRIHTGERPYSCGVCNKAFADRSNMLLHQRLHSGERPYVCEICKKSFSKNHHLKTHMNHHAGIKPYECPKCHARFSQSSNMKTHLKKCSGVPNPTTSQRQQMLRRNPLDIGRTSAQLPLPPLPGMMAAAAAAAAAAAGGGRPGEPGLPPLPPASRLISEQQQWNLLQQTIGGGQGMVGAPTNVPQLSPGHSRGQVPIESLLLHLNVSRSRHPSQGSIHSGAPPSPTTTMSFPELQLMLRNAAAVAAVSSGSRSAGQSMAGPRTYSSPSSPSSNAPTATVTTSGMTPIPGMASFGGGNISPSSIAHMRRNSPPHGAMGGDSITPPSLSPMMQMNPNLVGYGGRSDAAVMPPPSTNGTVLRSMSSSSPMIPPELLSPSSGNMLRVDTRGLESYPSGLSPPDKTASRQGRVVPNPMTSPRRKQPSPTSLSASGSFIPLSTLESAAIASGLRSPSQVVRFLSNALRDAENPLPQSSQPSSYTRLPSISHHNVLEAMVAAAAAEQNAQSVGSPNQVGGTRMRQVPSPPRHHSHQQPHHPQQHHHLQHQQQVAQQQAAAFQFSGELPSLSSLHMSQQAGVSSPEHHHHSNPAPQGVAPSYSVITSSHMLQQQQQQSQHLGLQQQQVRFSSASSPSNAASRIACTMDEHHVGASQPQQIELHHQQQSPQQRQQGYHQSLLLSHVSQQGSVATLSPTSGYSTSPNNSSNSAYSAFTHSIIRSRSHSPGTVEHLRERNQDYQN